MLELLRQAWLIREMDSLFLLAAQATDSSAYESGRLVGQIVFLVVLLVGMLWLLKKLLRKKK